MKREGCFLKKVFYILSLTAFAAGCGLLAYGAYLYLFPQNAVNIERIAPPSPILTTWQKDLICSRTHPTPLFLNFYGDNIDQKIIVMFGREKEIARLLLYPKIIIGGRRQNVSAYSILKDGSLKDFYELDQLESADYMKNLTLSPDEEKFLRLCFDKAMSFKFDI